MLVKTGATAMLLGKATCTHACRITTSCKAQETADAIPCSMILTVDALSCKQQRNKICKIVSPGLSHDLNRIKVVSEAHHAVPSGICPCLRKHSDLMITGHNAGSYHNTEWQHKSRLVRLASRGMAWQSVSEC